MISSSVLLVLTFLIGPDSKSIYRGMLFVYLITESNNMAIRLTVNLPGKGGWPALLGSS